MLMLGAPVDIDREALCGDLCGVKGVEHVHHVHIWEIEERRPSLEAHVVIGDAHWPASNQVKLAIRDLLKDRYGIAHSTLEIEQSKETSG